MWLSGALHGLSLAPSFFLQFVVVYRSSAEDRNGDKGVHIWLSGAMHRLSLAPSFFFAVSGNISIFCGGQIWK